MASSLTIRTGVTRRGTLDVAAQTKKLDVLNGISLKYYYLFAENLLEQARVFRDEGNVIDYYILLLRFASLVSETIPEHPDYRLCDVKITQDYRRKLLDIVKELEKLKPEVQKQIEQDNKAFRRATASSHSLPSSSYSRSINLKPAFREKECGICAEMRPHNSFISTKGCAHEYCTKCCKRHAEMKILSGSSQIECPHPNCCHDFDIQQCSTLLSQLNFDILTTRQTEAAIPASQKVYCPFQGCSSLMEKPESSNMTFVECYSCHRGFCLGCNIPWHANKTCGEYRADIANAKRSGDQKLRDLARKEKWQVCPQCSRVVELKSGCYHITCWCKTEFCYLCRKKWENKKATCNCKLWDEGNIINQDPE